MAELIFCLKVVYSFFLTHSGTVKVLLTKPLWFSGTMRTCKSLNEVFTVYHYAYSLRATFRSLSGAKSCKMVTLMAKL